MIEFKIGTVDIANLFPHYFKAVVTFTLWDKVIGMRMEGLSHNFKNQLQGSNFTQKNDLRK
jgi:hypothetical protein